jgi:hypothetical protein
MTILYKLSNRLYTFSSKQAFFTLLAFLVVILITMQIGTNGMKQVDSAAEMLDMRYFGYSPAVVYDLLTRLGQTGRLIYTQQLGIDFLFAAVYAFFQSVMITGLMKRSNVNQSWRMLNLLPFLRSGLDGVENCLLFAIILQFPVKLQGMVALASTFTLLKWVVYALIMVTLFTLGGYMASKSITTNKIFSKAGKPL